MCCQLTEMNFAEEFWFKFVQSSAYDSERKVCETKQQLSKGSKLVGLAPFIDEKGVLRVGRLQNATIPFNEQHLVILPGNSVLSKMIIRLHHANSFAAVK